jgi:hypothetical protein
MTNENVHTPFHEDKGIEAFFLGKGSLYPVTETW